MAKVKEQFKTFDEAKKRLDAELNTKDIIKKVDLRSVQQGYKLIIVSYPKKESE